MEKFLLAYMGLILINLVHIDQCAVQHSKTNKAIGTVKRILQKLQIPIYSEKSKKGIVRTIVARVGIQTGELQIVLITAKKELPKKEQIVEEIKKDFQK